MINRGKSFPSLLVVTRVILKEILIISTVTIIVFPKKSPRVLAVYSTYFTLAIIQIAWIIPGTYPSNVNRIFIQKCLPRPTCKNTPRGGRKIATIILTISIKTSFALFLNYYLDHSDTILLQLLPNYTVQNKGADCKISG
jgi:hypothetical protein